METAYEVKRAIADIKKIVDYDNMTSRKQKKEEPIQEILSERQQQVLKLRFDKKCSFAAIAQQLSISQKEVYQEFMAASRFTQQQQAQSL